MKVVVSMTRIPLGLAHPRVALAFNSLLKDYAGAQIGGESCIYTLYYAVFLSYCSYLNDSLSQFRLFVDVFISFFTK
jgi:hypothetical protein